VISKKPSLRVCSDSTALAIVSARESWMVDKWVKIVRHLMEAAGFYQYRKIRLLLQSREPSRITDLPRRQQISSGPNEPALAGRREKPICIDDSTHYPQAFGFLTRCDPLSMVRPALRGGRAAIANQPRVSKA
jgi:hypothetical protein